MEFQIVGGPIPDNQLIELQGMLLAVAVSNGCQWLSRQLEMLHRFQMTQLQGIACLVQDEWVD